MIIGIIYATFVYDIRPHKTSIYKSFLALLLFFLITIPVNLFLDANYFWICGKPPVGTVLDYFGPWPWYLIVATLLALIHFYFFYHLINFISSKISKWGNILKSYHKELWLNIEKRMDFINITPDVEQAVIESGIKAVSYTHLRAHET